jgi:hypothetical protein
MGTRDLGEAQAKAIQCGCHCTLVDKSSKKGGKATSCANVGREGDDQNVVGNTCELVQTPRGVSKV